MYTFWLCSMLYARIARKDSTKHNQKLCTFQLPTRSNVDLNYRWRVVFEDHLKPGRDTPHDSRTLNTMGDHERYPMRVLLFRTSLPSQSFARRRSCSCPSFYFRCTRRAIARENNKYTSNILCVLHRH